jgi:amidophosphoribosyltransferase
MRYSIAARKPPASSYDGSQFSASRSGLVGDNFGSKDVIDRLPGTVAIGHVRYRRPVSGAAQHPAIIRRFRFGGLAICHNGNPDQFLPAAASAGAAACSIDQRHRVIVHLIATSLKGVVERLTDALRRVEGAIGGRCRRRR